MWSFGRWLLILFILHFCCLSTLQFTSSPATSFMEFETIVYLVKWTKSNKCGTSKRVHLTLFVKLTFYPSCLLSLSLPYVTELWTSREFGFIVTVHVLCMLYIRSNTERKQDTRSSGRNDEQEQQHRVKLIYVSNWCAVVGKLKALSLSLSYAFILWIASFIKDYSETNESARNDIKLQLNCCHEWDSVLQPHFQLNYEVELPKSHFVASHPWMKSTPRRDDNLIQFRELSIILTFWGKVFIQRFSDE